MGAVLQFVKPQETQQAKKMQEGFVAIPNDVEDALLRSPLTHRQERVYRAILRKTLGFGKQSDYVATSQIAEMTGIDGSDVRKALNDLVDMGMIFRGNRKAIGTSLTPVLAVESWAYETNRVNHPEQGESPRLPPQTGRITPNKQGDLPPTIDNYNKQTTSTPCSPPSAESAQLTEAVSAEPAKPKKSTAAKTFRKWAEDAKAAGEILLPAEDPVFGYAEDAGIPMDFLRLAWIDFRDYYATADARKKDWRATFRNFVKSSYHKIWWHNGSEYLLTSKGQQAMAVMLKREGQA